MIGMLLLVDYRLCSCCVVIGILLLESFILSRVNELNSVCYHYSSLTFETEEAQCTDNTEHQVESA